jgi:hypothetical protein
MPMKRLLASVGFFMSFTAFAAEGIDLTKSNLPYTDVGAQDPYALPISVLTGEGVLEGNPDGSFRPNRSLNRAEFLKIIIALRHPVFEPPERPCFPDVPERAWYFDEVCFARSWGIVEGYPDGTFRPEQSINYVEALKMLSEVFGYSITRQRGDEWFTPYLRAAKSQSTALPSTTPLDAALSRGQMAELAAKFLAESRFELERYLAVERGEVEEVEEGTEGTEGTEVNAENTSVPSITSITSNLLPNQLFTPSSPLPVLDATSSFLVLGEKNPIVATVKVRPAHEPVEVRQVKITLNTAVSSIASFEVFDDVGYLLGTATVDFASNPAGNVFTLDLSPTAAYYIEKDDQIVLAARPRTKTMELGGEGGQSVKASRIDVSAIGRWTSRSTLVETSGPDFQEHSTALAAITAIERSGSEKSVFATGIRKNIGAFRFEARRNTDTESDPAVESLSISSSAPSEVALSNLFIRGNDVETEHSCSISSSVITCSSIPASIGNLQSPRTITVYADVALSGSHHDPHILLELNRAGRPGAAGDITWSDGKTSFTWVPFKHQPVARGTSWE